MVTNPMGTRQLVAMETSQDMWIILESGMTTPVIINKITNHHLIIEVGTIIGIQCGEDLTLYSGKSVSIKCESYNSSFYCMHVFNTKFRPY